jgi:tetratricopeptide (TPR) repeat protein
MRLGLFQSRDRCVWWPVLFLIVGLAINPFLFFSLSWAEIQLATPTPTSYPSSALPRVPKEEDGPLKIWQEKNKYFLVVAVNETGGVMTELPFAAVDGLNVSEALAGLGYNQLATLIGKEANVESFKKWLQEIQNLPEDSTVIVYYSGHGATARENDKSDIGQDLWLQLYGQEQFGAHEGMSVTEIIKSARGKNFQRELVLILDASYSGQVGIAEALNLDLLGANTQIFSSNAEAQEAYSVDVPLGDNQMSAFTYSLLQALGPEWARTDENGDGILQFGEVIKFTQHKLSKFVEKNHLDKYLDPFLFWAKRDDLFLSYRRDKVRRWDSTVRDLLNLAALERTLPPDDSKNPRLPSKSHDYAKGIFTSPETPHALYARGLQALAQGQMGKARSFFLEAEAKEEQRWRHSQEKREQIMAKVRLGKNYLALGRTETYAGNYPVAARWYEKYAALYPSRDPNLLNEIGQAFSRGGSLDKAASFIKQAFHLSEEALDLTRKGVTVGTESVELFGSLLSRTFHSLASLVKTPEEFEEFRNRYQKSLELQKQLLGEDSPIIAEGRAELAISFLRQGKFAEAEPLLQEAMKLEFPAFLRNTSNLGLLRSHQQEYDRAKKLYQGALMVAEEVFGDEPFPIIPATLYNDLGQIDLGLKNFSEAKSRFSKALQIFQNLAAPDYHAIASVQYNLGLVHLKLGSSFDETEAYFNDALTTASKYLGDNDKTTRVIYSGYVEALRQMGRDERALALEKEYQERDRRVIRAQPGTSTNSTSE